MLIIFVNSSASSIINGVDLYVLVSSSMPEQAIYALSHDARKTDAAMVFKGLIDDSFKSTNRYFETLVKETSWGGLLDHDLFDEFDITHVPCFVLGKFDITGKIIKYDKICGNTTFDYVLEQFHLEGDMQEEAGILLKVLRGGGDYSVS